MFKITVVLFLPFILFFNLSSNCATHLTFTAHPTNTCLPEDQFNPRAEINYYYSKLLINIHKALLKPNTSLFDEIGTLSTWIGYDFDRSNLNALDIAYSNTKSMQTLLSSYTEYCTKYLTEHKDIGHNFERLNNCVNQLLNLFDQPNLPLTSFLEKYNNYIKKMGLAKSEQKILRKLKEINSDNSLFLSRFIEKYHFSVFKAQVRIDGMQLTCKDSCKEIFEVVEAINSHQKDAFSAIIIANFSSIDQLTLLKQIKKQYNISNIGTIPLVESQEDVDFLLKNIETILRTDAIPQIMKAGSDDTKFSGLASSILNFSRLGLTLQNLQGLPRPTLFIGMGSSVERLGGPYHFRKLLASILGDNETNRTIQGGEIEQFSSVKLCEEKLIKEIELSKIRGKINPEEISEVSHILNQFIGKCYQNFHKCSKQRNLLNQLISKDSLLALLIDNYQAGSRYNKKVHFIDNKVIKNNLIDLFTSIRAIDFQTAFVLCGIHPEFVPFSSMTEDNLQTLSKHAQNNILKTYLSALYILHKQFEPSFYQTLGLSEQNEFYKNSVSGAKVFKQYMLKNFKELTCSVDEALNQEEYLNYSSYHSGELLEILKKHKKTHESFLANKLSDIDMQTMIKETNKNFAASRNLLSKGLKN